MRISTVVITIIIMVVVVVVVVVVMRSRFLWAVYVVSPRFESRVCDSIIGVHKVGVQLPEWRITLQMYE